MDCSVEPDAAVEKDLMMNGETEASEPAAPGPEPAPAETEPEAKPAETQVRPDTAKVRIRRHFHWSTFVIMYGPVCSVFLPFILLSSKSSFPQPKKTYKLCSENW